MKIQKFVASNLHKAMQKVQEALGPDALIYSTNSTATGVEIHAGLAPVGEEGNETFDQATTAPLTVNYDKKMVSSLNSQIQSLEEKLKQLSNFIENKFLHQFYSTDDESLVQKNLLFFHLGKLGFKGSFAQQFINDYILSHHMIDKIDETEVEKELLKYIKTDSSEFIDESGVFALIGPTGIGKTTTIAKLASRYAARYGAGTVGIITTDHHDVFNKNQLLNFCEKAGIELEYANSPRELVSAFRVMQCKRITLIDTHGVGQRDQAKIEKLMEMLEKQKVNITTMLALPCNVQESVLDEIAQSFMSKNLRGVILTKQDEANSINTALSVCMKHQLNIAYICNGQDIKNDIHKLTPKEVFSLINSNVLPIPVVVDKPVKKSLINKLSRKKASVN